MYILSNWTEHLIFGMEFLVPTVQCTLIKHKPRPHEEDKSCTATIQNISKDHNEWKEDGAQESSSHVHPLCWLSRT